MAGLLADPAGFAVSFIVALLAAWKAAALFEARSKGMAIAVGASAGLAGPLIAGDLMTAGLKYFAGAGDGGDAFELLAPELFSFVSPLGFALIGALAWCSWERS